MANQKLREAQELIRQKRYDEARALLKDLDHPTAREWLNRLDKRPTREVKAAPRTGGRGWMLATFGLLIVVVAMVALLIVPPLLNPPPPTSAPTLAPATAVAAAPTASSTPECWIEGWWADAGATVVRFLDAFEIVGNTSRELLGPVVLIELQTIYRDFERAAYPPCLTDVRANLLNGMKNIIDGFTIFINNVGRDADTDRQAVVRLSVARQDFKTAYDWLVAQGFNGADARLNRGVPTPTPAAAG